MVKFVVEELKRKEERVDIVEVKGLGHPDSICDTIVEIASKELTKYYLKHFNKILYFNIDKALLISGKAKTKFNGGEFIDPIKIIIVGKAITKMGNVIIPVERIIKNSVINYLKKFEFAKFEVVVDVREGASNLKEGFKRNVHVANGSSVSVAFYPLSNLANLVKNTVEHIVSNSFRKKFKEVGYDVKILGVKIDNNINLTLSLAFVDKYIKDLEHYRNLKHEIKIYLEKFTNAAVNINTLDSFVDASSIYLTVSGLSAELGDDGGAGRGNRYNGLITPLETMTIESYAGKNVLHPGKIYQAIAEIIAQKIVNKAKADKVEVRIVTEIGKPLSEPALVSVKCRGTINLRAIKDIIDDSFNALNKIQKEIIFS